MRLSGSVMEILPFEEKGSSRKVGRSVGRSSVVGRLSVLHITLISYTPLRYVRDVARKE